VADPSCRIGPEDGMSTVGLVVNPGASRDVRRLTSLARAIDANEQANTVARVLSGLGAGGVEAVAYMPEPSHVVERAGDMLRATPTATASGLPRLSPVTLGGDGYAHDAAGTTAAAAALAGTGAGCLIVIGGDGTNRAVVAGWPEAVIVPLAGGTNNAFGTRVDATAAGYAAALFAADPQRHRAHLATRPRLDVRVDGLATLALVDLAVVRGGWVGAHAIWDPDLLVEAIVTRSDPTIPGLAGVAGAVHPLGEGEPGALHLVFEPAGRPYLAPLGPGQLVPVRVSRWQVVSPGVPVSTPGRGRGGDGPVTLAFDGEREITLEDGQVAEARLVADGPRVLDVAGLLRAVAREGGLTAQARNRPGPAPAGGGAEPNSGGAEPNSGGAEPNSGGAEPNSGGAGPAAGSIVVGGPDTAGSGR
jgi:hypothetical protein